MKAVNSGSVSVFPNLWDELLSIRTSDTHQPSVLIPWVYCPFSRQRHIDRATEEAISWQLGRHIEIEFLLKKKGTPSLSFDIHRTVLRGSFYGGFQLEYIFFGEPIMLLVVIISLFSPPKKKPGFNSSGQLNIVQRPVTLPCSQHGTFFMSPLLTPRIFRWIPEFRKICETHEVRPVHSTSFSIFVYFIQSVWSSMIFEFIMAPLMNAINKSHKPM
jgi:hypothetical protein